MLLSRLNPSTPSEEIGVSGDRDGTAEVRQHEAEKGVDETVNIFFAFVNVNRPYAELGITGQSRK